MSHRPSPTDRFSANFRGFLEACRWVWKYRKYVHGLFRLSDRPSNSPSLRRDQVRAGKLTDIFAVPSSLSHHNRKITRPTLGGVYETPLKRNSHHFTKKKTLVGPWVNLLQPF